jgi:hypothetical protein
MTPKRGWLLLVLHQGPLDSIRLARALFLIGRRIGAHPPHYYGFLSYHHGSLSLDLYVDLASAEREHLVSQAPHRFIERVPYHLTPKGASQAAKIARSCPEEILALVREAVRNSMPAA